MKSEEKANMILKEEGEISFEFDSKNVLKRIGHTLKISVHIGNQTIYSKQMLRVLIHVILCDPSLCYFIFI